MLRRSGDSPDIRIVSACCREDYAKALGEGGNVKKDHQGDRIPDFNEMLGESVTVAYRSESAKIEIYWANWGYTPHNELGKRFGLAALSSGRNDR